MSKIFKLPVDEKKIIKECCKLIRDNITLIQYPTVISEMNWTTEAKKVKTIKIDSKEKKGYIYCILIPCKEQARNVIIADENYYQMKYIGKSNSLWVRLRQHLINRPEKTSSCFEKVKQYILKESEDKKIYISYFQVVPAVANSYVETLLLEHFLMKNSLWVKRKS